MKYLIIALFIYIAYKVVKNLRSISTSARRAQTQRNAIGEPKELIACAKCGTFVLKSNALVANSNYFCSEKCINA